MYQPSQIFSSLADKFKVTETKVKHERHNIKPMKFHGRVNVEKHVPIKPMTYAKYSSHEKPTNMKPLVSNAKTPRERRFDDIKPVDVMGNTPKGKQMPTPESSYRYSNVTYNDLVDRAAFRDQFNPGTYDPYEELHFQNVLMTKKGELRPEFVKAFELEESEAQRAMLDIIQKRTKGLDKLSKHVEKKEAKGIAVEPIVQRKMEKAGRLLEVLPAEILQKKLEVVRRKRKDEDDRDKYDQLDEQVKEVEKKLNLVVKGPKAAIKIQRAFRGSLDEASLEKKIEKYTEEIVNMQRELIHKPGDPTITERLGKANQKKEKLEAKLEMVKATAAKKAGKPKDDEEEDHDDEEGEEHHEEGEKRDKKEDKAPKEKEKEKKKTPSKKTIPKELKDIPLKYHPPKDLSKDNIERYAQMLMTDVMSRGDRYTKWLQGIWKNTTGHVNPARKSDTTLLNEITEALYRERLRKHPAAAAGGGGVSAEESKGT